MAQQWFLPQNEITVSEEEIQGDILVGLQKRAEVFVFFQIAQLPIFKTALHQIVPHLAFTRGTRIYEETRAGDVVKANIAFTFDGLKALGQFAAVPATLDASFKAGAKDEATALGDDLNDWLPSFKGVLHGVLLVAAWNKDTDAALQAAEARATVLKGYFGTSFLEIHREVGRVRTSISDGTQHEGHEHFGFADGVSQPGTKGLTLPVAENGAQSFPGQDLVEPGDFLLGNYKRQDGHVSTPPEPWMANGSYMVFRRLRQDVNAFATYAQAHWHGFAASEAQFKARLVGRWEDGTPLVRDPTDKNLTENEDHPEKNNDFAFGAEDLKQEKCPFAAHIRRIYPRDDLKDDMSERRRIIRAGIAYGRDTDADKGLLFVCYQSSIIDKFEFIQKSWANNPTFKPDAVGIVAPPQPGIDLIIGQGGAPRDQTWSNDKKIPVAPKFVTATGGGYFFSPSRAGLAHLAT